MPVAHSLAKKGQLPVARHTHALATGGFEGSSRMQGPLLLLSPMLPWPGCVWLQDSQPLQHTDVCQVQGSNACFQESTPPCPTARFATTATRALTLLRVQGFSGAHIQRSLEGFCISACEQRRRKNGGYQNKAGWALWCVSFAFQNLSYYKPAKSSSRRSGNGGTKVAQNGLVCALFAT